MLGLLEVSSKIMSNLMSDSEMYCLLFHGIERIDYSQCIFLLYSYWKESESERER